MGLRWLWELRGLRVQVRNHGVQSHVLAQSDHDLIYIIPRTPNLIVQLFKLALCRSKVRSRPFR